MAMTVGVSQLETVSRLDMLLSRVDEILTLLESPRLARYARLEESGHISLEIEDLRFNFPRTMRPVLQRPLRTRLSALRMR